MIDFMLTKSGDLMFVSETRKDNKVKVKFFVSPSNAVKVSFFLDDFAQLAADGRNQIKVSFDLKDEKTTGSIKMATKSDFAKQASIIRFKTQKGELPERAAVGSLLELVKHEFLFSKQTLNYAKKLAQEALSDIYPNADIKVEPVAKHFADGYKQILVVKVYDENIIILEHELG